MARSRVYTKHFFCSSLFFSWRSTQINNFFLKKRKYYQGCLEISLIYTRSWIRAGAYVQRFSGKNYLRQRALCSMKKSLNTENNWRLFYKKSQTNFCLIKQCINIVAIVIKCAPFFLVACFFFFLLTDLFLLPGVQCLRRVLCLCALLGDSVWPAWRVCCCHMAVPSCVLFPYLDSFYIARRTRKAVWSALVAAAH